MSHPFTPLTPLTTAGMVRAQRLFEQVNDEIAMHHEVAHEVGLLLPASTSSPNVAGPGAAVGLGTNTLEQVVARHLQSTSQNLLFQMQHSLQAHQKLLAQRHAQRMAEVAASPKTASQASPPATQVADVVIDVVARDVTSFTPPTPMP